MTPMPEPNPELLTSVVLEELSPEELLVWEAQRQENPALVQEVAELRAAWHSLAYACEAMDPPPHLKQRILATAPSRPRYWLGAVAAAGIAGTLGLGLWNWQLQRQWRLAQQELHMQRAVIAALQRQDTRMATLTGTPAAQGAMARVLTVQGEVLVVLNDKLPPPPKNHVYVLWAITRDNRRLACGKFVPNKNGIIHWAKPHFMPNDPQVVALAVTTEPDLVDVPSGLPVMRSSGP
ncbi:MAG: anti-sigma factor [Gloeomargarita sp. SKYBB_i_bin120]|nr:anti-sigma factor [Gloeomargarita sp. SKYG98]MCS7293479.1 anti-sigma factor [Gloeomargarita sp. SKYB120]MDW8179045.1 anti-sigma factor [Gloeomargarita sp. SKYBB_i_bin120]